MNPAALGDLLFAAGLVAVILATFTVVVLFTIALVFYYLCLIALVLFGFDGLLFVLEEFLKLIVGSKGRFKRKKFKIGPRAA